MEETTVFTLTESAMAHSAEKRPLVNNVVLFSVLEFMTEHTHLHSQQKAFDLLIFFLQLNRLFVTRL